MFLGYIDIYKVGEEEIVVEDKLKLKIISSINLQQPTSTHLPSPKLLKIAGLSSKPDAHSRHQTDLHEQEADKD